jgi:hypothetical protein
MFSRDSVSRLVLVVLFGLNGSACLAATEITSEANNINKLIIHAVE